VPWRIFSKSIVAYTKMGRVSKTMPLLGEICHPFGKTSHDQAVYQIWNIYIHPLWRYERWEKKYRIWGGWG